MGSRGVGAVVVVVVVVVVVGGGGGVGVVWDARWSKSFETVP